MKYLFVCEAVFPEDKGGVERWFKKLTTELSSRGHDITYLNASGVNEVRDGVTYKSVTAKNWFYLPGGVRSKRQALNFARQIFLSLIKTRADVVYLTSVPILTVIPIAGVKLVNKKLLTIIEWHEIWPLKYWMDYAGKLNGLIGWFIQLAALQVGDYKVTYTERTRKNIQYFNTKKMKSRSLILPGMCDPDFTKITIEQNELREDLSFLGRFVDEKQPIFALECAMRFIDTGWKGFFWVMGKGPSITSMQDLLSKSPKYANQIRILENPTDEIVREKMRSSFALLHPSKREGYGLASIEAAYLGTPSILLNYANNGTIDLSINPELVVTEFTLEEVLEKLRIAHDNQQKYRAEALDWSLFASKNRSIISTVDNLELIVEAKNG